MKHFLVIIIISLVSYNFFSQNIDSIVVSGAYNDIPVIDFLDQIENQYPVQFYYKTDWFNNYNVDLYFNNIPLKSALAKIFAGKPYIYKILQKNMIVFLPKEEVALVFGDMVDYSRQYNQISTILIGDLNDVGKYKQVILKGSVYDGKTGNPIIGAAIQIQNTSDGAITNDKGEYSIILKPGIYSLIVSSIGFEKTTDKVKIVSNGKLDIELFEESFKIDEIAVYAQRADRNVRKNQMSLVELDSKTIKQLPSVTGDKDILKTLTMMPGVKSIGEFGSGINVRGGGEDQNLYLIEGTPIYNTSHVFGLLSAVNPDAVSSLTLYKGHIPSEFGERVSSVMDIRLKDDNGIKLKSKGGIGLYNSRLMIEGPIVKDKISFKIGGRTSYSDFLLTKLNDYYLANSSASFYDLNGLLNINLKNNYFTFFGYTSFDRFKYANIMGYSYGNRLASFNWGHFFNSNFSFSLLISNSNYDVTKEDLQPILYEKKINSDIEYTSAKLNFTYTGISNHIFEGGIQVINYSIQPGILNPLNDSSLIDNITLEKEQGMERAVYINDKFDITSNVSLNLGLRYSNYRYLGPNSVATYRENQPVSEINIKDTIPFAEGEMIENYKGLEPRASLKIQVDNSSSVKLSFNRNIQYIKLISYTAISTPEDVWKLSDNYLQPLIANQCAIGYFKNFLGNIIETSVEVYYKKLKNLSEYKNGAEISMNNTIETELINADGKNYGIELFVRKNRGVLTGWIGYTYSKSLIKTNGKYAEEIINNNQYYSSSFDKPHDLNILATYHINRRWRFSGNFNYSSGRPITLPEYKFTIQNQEYVYYSNRNKYRLPSYNRLDLSISLDESLRIKKKWKGSWTLSILNVYGRKNAYTVFYKKESTKFINCYNYNLYKMYLIGKPLPTLTYNFIF